MSESDVVLRPGTPADLPAVADLYLRARAAAVPAMPPIVHTPEEVRSFVGGFDLESGERELWVAHNAAGALRAYAELKGDWLDDLYVDPDAAGQGLGTALLEVCKARRPDGFSLWVFESNEVAREFYRRKGLLTLERTDGSANEEGAPDLRMAWPGVDPVAFLRARIDEVDEQLALLLAQRFALTSAVQRTKPVGGHAGRDLDRERQIAERMAGPTGLPVAAVERIVHTIISESLDAHEAGVSRNNPLASGR